VRVRSDPFQTDDRIPNVAAARYFTDREDAIGAFHRAISTPAGRPLQALVFYGVGGIGKTALLQRLCELMPESLPFALVDLRNIGDRTAAYRDTLLKFRSDLARLPKADFPLFDLCLSVMLEREGGDPPPLVRLNPRLAGVLEAVTGLAKGLPGPVGGPAQAIESVIKGTIAAFPALQDLVRRAGGTAGFFELRARAIRDDPTLPADLIRFFARDLAEHLPERPGSACRGVLLLDTYEQLWAGRDAASSQARHLDWWVADLVRFCLHDRVGVLPVIASRDSIRWSDDDPSWADLVVQYPIGGLAPQDAQSFLARCGIGHAVGAPPSELQDAIIRCCDTGQRGQRSCHPLYLALCADIVRNTRDATGADPPLGTFVGLPERRLAAELAARFLTSLHSSAMESWVTDLSLTPQFDEAAALALDSARQHYNGRPGWARLARLSFVEPHAGGFYRLHKTMRDALRDVAPTGDARRVHEWFGGYWQERGEPALAWFHRWTLDPPGAMAEWARREDAALQTQSIGEARRLLVLWSEVSLDEADRRALGDRVWAETHAALAAALLKTPVAPRHGSLAAALDHLRFALAVQTETELPGEWARNQLIMAGVYAELPTGSRDENLRRAIACAEAALRVYDEHRFPQEWARVRYILARVFTELPTGNRDDNLRQAIAHCRAAGRVYAEAETPQLWAAAQGILGNAYLKLQAGDRQHNLELAIACYEAALRVFTGTAAAHMRAEVQVNLGTAYSELLQGDRGEHLRRAVASYTEAERVFTETDFPEQWAALQNNLGSLGTDLSPEDPAAGLRRAIAHFEAALRVHTEDDFPLEWARLQGNLGVAYHALGDGDLEGNLRRSVASYEAAMRIYSPDEFFHEWADVTRGLAGALLESGKMTADAAALRRARELVVGLLQRLSAAGMADGAADLAEGLAEIDSAIDAHPPAGA
jgi:tetratricopeptide (TPR) repeat protein